MFKLMSTIIVLLAAQSSFATTYNIVTGQNASLQSGDVVIVRDAYNQVSAVTCAGALTPPPLPARQQFQVDRPAKFMSLFQTADDATREIQCSQYSADQGVHQAISDALNAAREQCFEAGYQNCAQPMTTDEQYSFHVRGYPGEYVCDVLARIIGTQPN